MRIILLFIQLISAILLIVFIIMQAKGVGLGGAFGGEGTFYRSRRGVEKILYFATITTSIIFMVISLLLVFLSS